MIHRSLIKHWLSPMSPNLRENIFPYMCAQGNISYQLAYYKSCICSRGNLWIYVIIGFILSLLYLRERTQQPERFLPWPISNQWHSHGIGIKIKYIEFAWPVFIFSVYVVTIYRGLTKPPSPSENGWLPKVFVKMDKTVPVTLKQPWKTWVSQSHKSLKIL